MPAPRPWRPSEGANQLVARIRLAGSADLIQVVERLRRIFDLGADPEEISVQLGRDPYLARAFEDFPGLRVPGVGEWTAQYIAMRALGEPDAFPATDLGLRRALGPGAKPIAGRRLAEIAEAWRPWRAYAAMALWMSQASGQS
jgi:3-methyladenine DNA glycosylase/8-oxoguanine DNA glycosylase